MRKNVPERPSVKRKRILPSWQEAELSRYLKKNAGDPLLNSKTVFLANPEERKRIDKIIAGYLWPGIVRALAGTSIRVPEGDEGFPRSLLQDEEKIHTTRSLTFVLEDPDRPLLPGGGAPWFCRGCIECSMLDYLISFDFYAHFPIHFDFRKIIELLSDPMFEGNPPNLSVEPRMNGDHIFVVSFTEGSGAGWGLTSYQEAGYELEEKVTQNLVVIGAMYQLERDYKSERWFLELQEALRDAYQAY